MILFVQGKFILARVGFVSGRTRWFGLVSITSPSDSVLELNKKNTLALFYYGGGIEAKRSWGLLKEIIIKKKGLIRSVYTGQNERWRWHRNQSSGDLCAGERSHRAATRFDVPKERGPHYEMLRALSVLLSVPGRAEQKCSLHDWKRAKKLVVTWTLCSHLPFASSISSPFPSLYFFFSYLFIFFLFLLFLLLYFP